MRGRVIAPALLALIASSAGVAGDKEPATVLVKIKLYARDATGKLSVAPNIKFHVTKLGVDPISSADGAVPPFYLPPGDHTLTTVTGNVCSFNFKVSAGKPADIALIVPSTGGSCQPATPEALAGPGPIGSAGSAVR